MPDQPEPTNPARPAMTMREIREALGHAIPDPAASGVQPDTRRPVPGCLFCHPGTAENRVVAEAGSAYLRLDNYPSASGHMEVVPKRHVESFFDLTSAELDDVYTLACDARAHIPDPDGWTIGVNEGRAGGRTIDHLHVHLIPRRHGDVPDPRGGVRWVLPGTAALPTACRCHSREGLTAEQHENDCRLAVSDEEPRDLHEALRKARRAVGLLAGSHREAERLGAELEQARAAVAELGQAIRLTREYVGEELLPPVEGWSWYDALRRHAPQELTAAGSGGQAEDGAQQPNPLAVCVCGHSRDKHVTVSGRLLCDECDTAAEGAFVCKEFEVL